MKRQNEYYKGGTVPWLLSGEVGQRDIAESKNFITQLGLENSSAKLFPPNTVLIAMYGATSGQVGVLRFEASTNQAVCGILPNENFIPDFLYYYFLYQQRELIAQAVGNAQPNISQKKIKDTYIPVISIPEQKRIAAILDEAFEGIATATANAEKNLANARELFESYLSSVFAEDSEGWIEEKLGNVCDLISGQHIPVKEYNSDENGIGYLTGPSDFGHMHPVVSKWTEHPRRTACGGDVLITVKGSGVGKINLLDQSELAISRQLMAIRANGVNKKYLYMYVSTKFDYFQQLATGAAIPGISREDVLNLPLPLPPIPEQNRIVEQINTFAMQNQRLEAIYQRKLNDLAELKQSILQKAFAGELHKAAA